MEEEVNREMLNADVTLKFREVRPLRMLPHRILCDKMTKRMIPLTSALETATVDLVEYDGGINPTGMAETTVNDVGYQRDYYSKGQQWFK